MNSLKEKGKKDQEFGNGVGRSEYTRLYYKLPVLGQVTYVFSEPGSFICKAHLTGQVWEVSEVIPAKGALFMLLMMFVLFDYSVRL